MEDRKKSTIENQTPEPVLFNFIKNANLQAHGGGPRAPGKRKDEPEHKGAAREKARGDGGAGRERVLRKNNTKGKKVVKKSARGKKATVPTRTRRGRGGIWEKK